MIKTTTKKQIGTFLRDFNFKEEHPFGWELHTVYAVIHNSKVEFGVHYIGKGVSELIYNGAYDKWIEFSEVIREYKNKQYTLKDITDIIYDRVKGMEKNITKKGMLNMYKTYKSYESLEGRVAKAIKKSVGNNKSASILTSVIAVDIWNRAKRQSKVPNDTDISFGIYEYLGAAR